MEVDTGRTQTKEGKSIQENLSKAVAAHERDKGQRTWAGTSNKEVQTTGESLLAPAAVSAATQTMKGVSSRVEVGTSMAGQRPGQQDAKVQTEESGEKLVNASGDDTESLHSQVRISNMLGRLYFISAPRI